MPNLKRLTGLNLLFIFLICLPLLAGEPIFIEDFLAAKGMDVDEFGSV